MGWESYLLRNVTDAGFFCISVNDWTYHAAKWNRTQNGIEVWLFIASDPLPAFRQLLEARWLLYVMSGSKLKASTFCPHNVFVFFLWMSEQTAVISLYCLFLLGAFVRLRESDYELCHICLSVCLSVRPSARNNSAPTRRIFMTLRVWVFSPKICRQNSSFIKIWHVKASWNVMAHLR